MGLVIEIVMYTLRTEILINAPIERCFDLARSVEAHVQSTQSTGERVVAGRMSGLLEMDEEVTWEAVHFGVRQRLTSRIVAFEFPRFFRDQMVRGAFAMLEHDHLFETVSPGVTKMIDVLKFKAPLGPLGWIAEWVFLGRYMQRFLMTRAQELKTMAESDDWQRYCG